MFHIRRWLKSRVKRCLVFFTFLAVVSALSLAMLSAANRVQLGLTGQFVQNTRLMIDQLISQILYSSVEIIHPK